MKPAISRALRDVVNIVLHDEAAVQAAARRNCATAFSLRAIHHLRLRQTIASAPSPRVHNRHVFFPRERGSPNLLQITFLIICACMAGAGIVHGPLMRFLDIK